MSTSQTTTPDAGAAKAPAFGGDPTSLTRLRQAPTHPGEIFFHEVLNAEHGAQSDAARAMGWSVNRMNEFINAGGRNRGRLSIAGAVDLALYSKTSPEFWMHLQTRFDLWHELQARKAVKKGKRA